MRHRRFTAALLAAALLGLSGASARAASGEAVVAFTGEIRFYSDPARTQPTGLWSPAAPGCGLPLPICPGQLVYWSLDTTTGPLGQPLCAFARQGAPGWVVEAGVRQNHANAGGPCSVSGDGVLDWGAFGRGAYCEYSQGPIINLVVTLGSATYDLVGTSVQHLGRLHAWTLWEPFAKLPAGVALMEFVHDGANPTDGAACGLNPIAGSQPSTHMKVSGSLVLTALN